MVFSFCLCKPGFSISGTSTPNGLFQTNNELKKDQWVTPNGSNNYKELFVNYEN